MRPFRLASLLVLAGLFGAMALPGMATAAPAARKADKDLARAAFLRGTKHYNLNEYKEALDSFKDAYRAYEEPSFLFNIAQCQRQLGMRADAIRSYRAYLREGSNIRNREDVEQIIAGLERSVRDEETTRARPPQGTLGPDGAPGRVNPDAPSGTTTPATLMVTAQPAHTPVYKKWWLWTIVGVAAVGLGVGLGLGLTQGPSFPDASTPGGRVRF